MPIRKTKEAGSLLLIDTDGTVSYDGEMDHIKGRGNTTWNLAKKPYNIKLSKKSGTDGNGKKQKMDPSCQRAGAFYAQKPLDL